MRERELAQAHADVPFCWKATKPAWEVALTEYRIPSTEYQKQLPIAICQLLSWHFERHIIQPIPALNL